MSADKSFTPSRSDLQEIFDDVPYIEQSFLWEAMIAQEDFFKARKKWESVAALLDKMLESGLPVESGQLEVRRADGEQQFEIAMLWPWVPPPGTIPPEKLAQWEKHHEEWLAQEREKTARRNAILRRFGLPELEVD